MQVRIALSFAVSVLALSSVARAEQFVLVDVTYEHSEETTNDSHFYPTLPSDTPKNWTSPVNYAGGSVHIVVDVKTKPSDAATKLQVCFEGTPAYHCTDQSPTYTAVGRVEWDSRFANFWQGGELDWSRGIKKSPIILKDTMNNKPAGDPDYMPTELRVQITLVSPGSTFVPPPAAGSGAAGAGGSGSGGVGGSSAGRGGAPSGGAGGSLAGSGGSAARGAAGAGGRAGAGGSGGGAAGVAGVAARSGGAGAAAIGGAGVAVAGVTAPPPQTTGPAGSIGTSTGSQTATTREPAATGCRSAGSSAHGAWWFALLLAAMSARRWRRSA